MHPWMGGWGVQGRCVSEGWQLHQWPSSTESSLHTDEVVAGPVVMGLRAPAVSEGSEHIRPGKQEQLCHVERQAPAIRVEADNLFREVDLLANRCMKV